MQSFSSLAQERQLRPIAFKPQFIHFPIHSTRIAFLCPFLLHKSKSWFLGQGFTVYTITIFHYSEIREIIFLRNRLSHESVLAHEKFCITT